jgi:hypothetical protein
LATIRKMIPWCFAADKTNYAWYLPVYFLQMPSIQGTSHSVFEWRVHCSVGWIKSIWLTSHRSNPWWTGRHKQVEGQRVSV